MPSTSAETGRSRTLPPRDDYADAVDNVFISLDATAANIRKLVFEGEQITFVRAPVAAGKTTLANFLVSTFPEEYVLVETGVTEDEWLENLMNAYDGEEAVANARQAVRAIEKQKKVLIMDEAHLLFGCPKIYAKLTKLWTPKIKILLFSAAATGLWSDGTVVATPSDIYKKYMWYPPIPDGKDLTPQLEEADIFLDAAAVDFLMKICCGHRGIFMAAVRWVQDQQQASGATKWDLNKCITEVRHSFEESDKQKRRNIGNGWAGGLRGRMKDCRAVKVSGMYSDLNCIPKEFIDVLFGGSLRSDDLNNKERELTIAGFLVPERKNSADGEFVLYDWNDLWTRYGVTNSLMAQYYNDSFSTRGYQRNLTQFVPKSGSDLLSRALPFMTFTTVVDNVIINDGKLKTSLSPQALPYEDHYNDALAGVFTDLGYTVAQPKDAEGKVDLIVHFEDGNSNKKTCVIETIMTHRRIVSYSQKVLVVDLLTLHAFSQAFFSCFNARMLTTNTQDALRRLTSQITLVLT
jgi:hypothetical protein